MLSRLLQKRLISTSRSCLLLGPRQVGKSTICRSLNPTWTLDLSDPELFLRYAKDPGLLRRELLALPTSPANAPELILPELILIDEIQRVPELLNGVQGWLDQPPAGRKIRFLLTGSSARNLRRRGANLLPGRVTLEHLDPLSALELVDPLDLDRALRLGMLPGVYLNGKGSESAEAEAVLGAYAQLYLREEIRAEGAARDLGGFARFLDVAATVSGQWLNYSKVASDTEIPKETIRRYVSLLEDTLVAFRLPAFQPGKSVTRRVSQRDRLFLFDLGVRNALLGLHRQPIPATERGPVFEQWLILQVIYLNRALQKDWRLSSYRAEGGGEVDLVIDRGDCWIGLEIKASRNVGASDLRGLKSLDEICKSGKPLRRWIAYLGDSRQRFEDGTWAIPYLEVLKMLAADTTEP